MNNTYTRTFFFTLSVRMSQSLGRFSYRRGDCHIVYSDESHSSTHRITCNGCPFVSASMAPSMIVETSKGSSICDIKSVFLIGWIAPACASSVHTMIYKTVANSTCIVVIKMRQVFILYLLLVLMLKFT